MGAKFDTLTQAGQTSVLAISTEQSGQISLSGTFTGLQVAFEWTPDVPSTAAAQRWFPMPALRQDGSGVTENMSTVPATGQTWLVNTLGASQIRVRVVAITSGSATETINTSQAPFATQQLLSVNPSLGATFRTNAGSAAPGQSIKTYTGFVALSATLTTTIPLETVTAGKTFYITDIYISFDNQTQIRCRIQAAGVDIFQGIAKGDTAPIDMPGIESQPSAAAGTQVNLVLPSASGPPNCAFFIAGFEQ